jgi:hypothetical protein
MDLPHDFPEFIVWGFYTLLTGIIGFSAFTISQIARSIHELSLTVNSLTERLTSFEKALDRLDDRLEKLEDTNNN